MGNLTFRKYLEYHALKFKLFDLVYGSVPLPLCVALGV